MIAGQHRTRLCMRYENWWSLSSFLCMKNKAVKWKRKQQRLGLVNVDIKCDKVGVGFATELERTDSRNYFCHLFNEQIVVLGEEKMLCNFCTIFSQNSVLIFSGMDDKHTVTQTNLSDALVSRQHKALLWIPKLIHDKSQNYKRQNARWTLNLSTCIAKWQLASLVLCLVLLGKQPYRNSPSYKWRDSVLFRRSLHLF